MTRSEGIRELRSLLQLMQAVCHRLEEAPSEFDSSRSSLVAHNNQIRLLLLDLTYARNDLPKEDLDPWSHVQKLYNALQVMRLDHRIREWLQQNDPKALEQAMEAIAEAEVADPALANVLRRNSGGQQR